MDLMSKGLPSDRLSLLSLSEAKDVIHKKVGPCFVIELLGH